MSAKQPETTVNNNGSKNEQADGTILPKPKPKLPLSSSSLSSSRRTHSLSTSSSSSSSSSSFNSSSSFRSSNHEISPPPSPEGGIPFSWETIPGIPKTPIPLKHIDSSKSSYLPLPPAGTPVSSSHAKSTQKRYRISGHRKDPFFAALVECSKAGEGDEKAAVFGRHKLGWSFALGERFGFANLTGCKNACVVAESLVFIPRSPRRIVYEKVKSRAGIPATSGH